MALLVFACLTPGTYSGWASGALTNSTDTSLTGSLQFTHAYQSTTCTAGPAATVAKACAGSIAPTAATPASGTVTGTDAITNNGTITAGRLVQSVTVPSCAPVQFANAKTAADPLLARYDTAFQTTDKWGSTSAATLSGSGYAADVVVTNGGTFLGSNYTIGTWFRTASGYSQGGGLVSFSSSPANATSAAASPMLWMDTAGRIRYRVTGTLGTSTTGTSVAAYNDGSWHFVVLSVAAAGVSTPTMYVDGANGVSTAGLTALTGATGYWHVGWADFTGVGSSPSSASFHGSLSGSFVRGATTSSGTRTTLFGATSASDYQTKVLALSGILHLWMLADPGTTTYTGILPSSMTAPCTKVNVAMAFTSPVDSIATGTLSALANNVPRSVAAPGPGTTQTLTTSTSRVAGYNTDISGLHLYAPITIRVTTNPASSLWQLDFTWNDATSVFLA